jgi:hypothetical protein
MKQTTSWCIDFDGGKLLLMLLITALIVVLPTLFGDEFSQPLLAGCAFMALLLSVKLVKTVEVRG